MSKCTMPFVIKPDGEHELDPCVYEEKEVHTNVNVIVSKCKHCGEVHISWERTEDTEDIILGGVEDE